MKTAVILAGGKGTRLGTETPKCMLEIGGRTLLQHQIDWLDYEQFDNIIISTGHHHEKVHYKKPHIPYTTIAHETIPLGTGGAIKHATRTHPSLFQDGTLVINCDDLCKHHQDWPRTFQNEEIIVYAKNVPYTIYANNVLHPQNTTQMHIGHAYIPQYLLKTLPEKGSLEQFLQAATMNTIKPVLKIQIVQEDWTTINNTEQLSNARLKYG